ncbi:GntR family transcriptional regulator [Arthrobacter sp. MYb23]|uniref:GntR family transcriptional regulator n=1 Tax=unclassified Arthrobacter TaxID=235627 RepID=UPI000CFE2EA3|nr:MULTISPECIES: GntR family transcriptional regulator [unclassified Arthrobacter]PRB43050.1 GntR family transcriptional regulator [Arthrobacter sp. MYb51]PRB98002.1 GntR family transcriptional regulator [Arthrobacter sp. MYb23]
MAISLEEGTTSRAQPLRERVIADIREMILSGRVGQGTVLPETDLAEQLGVSRGPVRDALAALQREGLVTLRPNRRARVVSLGLRDVEEIYSLRGQLERLAVQRAALNVTDIDLAAMRKILNRMDSALERQDLIELSQLDTGFHDRIYEASRHDRLYRSWADLRSQVTLFLISRNTTAVTSRDVVVGEHEALLEALTARDTALLVRLMDDHLLGAYERLRDAMILASPNGI